MYNTGVLKSLEISYIKAILKQNDGVGSNLVYGKYSKVHGYALLGLAHVTKNVKV